MGSQFQFDLKRLWVVVTIAALIAGLFACLHLQIALLTLAVTDLATSIVFEIYRPKSHLGLLLLVSAVLVLATIYVTDSGSALPETRIAWTPLIAACFAHVATAFVWLFHKA